MFPAIPVNLNLVIIQRGDNGDSPLSILVS